MACFSGFRPFLTKGSTVNGVQNIFFSDGTIGAHYVPNETSVYSMSAYGTFDSSVSTVIDEKNGTPTFGSELILNGNFASGSSNWALTAQSSVSNGAARILSTDGSYQGVAQSKTLQGGKYYIVQFDVVSYTSGAVQFAFAGAGVNLGIVANATGSYSRIFYVSTTTASFLDFFRSGVTDIVISNISVKELPGNPATQSSTSLRPLLGRAPRYRRNLLNYTEQFDNAAWSKSGALSANSAVDPNGENNADIWTPASQFNTVTSASVARPLGTYTASIWMRVSSGSRTINLGISEDGLYLLTNPMTVTTTWQRFTATFNHTNLSFGIKFFVQDRNTSGFVPVEIYGAQLEVGSSATEYQRVVTTADITETGAISYPFIRFDLSDDRLDTTGIRSNKNLFLATEEFDNSAWVKSGITILPNVEIAPNGTQTADKIVGTNGHVGGKLIYQTPSIAAPYVYSFYAKAAEYYLIRAIEAGNYRYYATFNLNNQTVSATGGTNFVSANIQSVGNGWHRCSIVTNTTALGSPGAVAFPDNITPPTNTPASYTGDGSSGAYFWGAQAELGSELSNYEYGGFSGDVVVAGKNGTITTPGVKLPDGNFNLGATTYTGGTPNILRAVGDVVGYSLIGRTITDLEKYQLTEYYKSRGAKGLLVPGPELITNGTFDSGISGWSPVIAILEAVDGGMKITHGNASNAGRARTGTQIIVPGIYFVEYDVVSLYGDATGSRVQVGDTNVNQVGTRTSGSFTPSGGTGRKSFFSSDKSGYYNTYCIFWYICTRRHHCRRWRNFSR